MDLIQLIDPAYAACAFVVGALVGFTGVGGGSLMTPMLVLLFHIHPAQAVGTDLLYAAVTNTAGTAANGRRGTVDWRIFRRLAMGSMPAAAITLLLMWQFHAKAERGHGILTSVLGAALILSAISLVLRNVLLKSFGERISRLSEPRLALLTTVLGALLGALVAISSVGAGAIGMTVLLVLYPKTPTNRLVGSDIAHAVPLTLLAGLGHLWMGTVDMHLLLSLLTGSIPGILLGSFFAARAPDKVLRPILASTLAIVGGKLFF